MISAPLLPLCFTYYEDWLILSLLPSLAYGVILEIIKQ